MTAKSRLQNRDGYVAVALGWIVLSAFGACLCAQRAAAAMWTRCLRPFPASRRRAPPSSGAPASLRAASALARADAMAPAAWAFSCCYSRLMPKLGDSVNLMKAEPRPHLTPSCCRAVNRHGQNALKHLHSPHGGGNARAPRNADAMVRRGDHRAHDHLDRQLLRPQASPTTSPRRSTGSSWSSCSSSVNFTLLFLAGTRRWREVLRSDELRVYPASCSARRAHRARSCSQNGFRSSAPPSSTRPFRCQRSFPPPATAREDFDLGRSSAVLCCSL